MVLVLALGAVIWGVGGLMRLSARRRLGLLAGLWVAVVAVNLALPEGAALRTATGGDARVWLVLAGVVALGAGYRAAVMRLRGRAAGREAAVAAAAAAAAPPARMGAAELDRYARHLMLREIGGPGQQKLRAARVLVVGAGGLGAPALLYLAASGVGTIGVIDHDTVDVSNLQRQIIHTDARIGQPKVFSAAAQMAALNPHVTLRPYARRLTAEIAEALIADYDLVLDGTDDFDTRQLVNRVCASLGKPLIAAAITQWEGQIGLYDPARGGACYECVFPQRPAPGLAPSCAEAGVAAPLPGVLGAMMAMEAVKLLTGAGTGLRGRLVLWDGLHAETRSLTTRPRPGCAACGGAGAAAQG